MERRFVIFLKLNSKMWGFLVALLLILGFHGVTSAELYSDLDTKEEYSQSENVILLFGGSGSGKNTLAKILLDEDEYNKLQVVADGESHKIIGEDEEPRYPAWQDSGFRTYSYNTPSFDENRQRTPKEEFLVAFTMARMLKLSASVQLVFCMDAANLAPEGDLTEYKELVQDVAKLLPNLDKLRDSITLVATGVRSSRQDRTELSSQAGSFFSKMGTDLGKEPDGQRLIQLNKIFEGNLVFLRSPSKDGLLKDDKVMTKSREGIIDALEKHQYVALNPGDMVVTRVPVDAEMKKQYQTWTDNYIKSVFQAAISTTVRKRVISRMEEDKKANKIDEIIKELKDIKGLILPKTTWSGLIGSLRQLLNRLLNIYLDDSFKQNIVSLEEFPRFFGGTSIPVKHDYWLPEMDNLLSTLATYRLWYDFLEQFQGYVIYGDFVDYEYNHADERVKIGNAFKDAYTKGDFADFFDNLRDWNGTVFEAFEPLREIPNLTKVQRDELAEIWDTVHETEEERIRNENFNKKVKTQGAEESKKEISSGTGDNTNERLPQKRPNNGGGSLGVSWVGVVVGVGAVLCIFQVL